MLTIDIETKTNKNLLPIYLQNIKAPSNYKDPIKIASFIEEKAKEAELVLAVDQDYTDIVCIGVKEDSNPSKIVSIEELSIIWNNYWLQKSIYGFTPHILTFNGKGFDFPILIKYGIKNNIVLPYNKLYEGIKKYKVDWHIDLLELLAMNGQYKSLDQYLQIYLGVSKTPIDFTTCTKEELEAHCLSDLDLTYKLYKLFERML